MKSKGWKNNHVQKQQQHRVRKRKGNVQQNISQLAINGIVKKRGEVKGSGEGENNKKGIEEEASEEGGKVESSSGVLNP